MTPDLPRPFGRYVLLKQLSQGGMGRVYKALLRGDTGFEKQVAIKLLLKELYGEGEFVTRFADEARTACSLSHANIVQVFDFGTVEGEYYLTMEYVDGPDLGQLLTAHRVSDQRVDVAAALYIAATFCRGLAAAHRRQGADGLPQPVVHRDVSPQNVMVSRAGEVKVTDFGIAKAASNVLRTRTGMVVGKCRYLAPEQALGQPVAPTADVFSAAAVLFEMLAGRPLFDGGQPEEVMRAVVTAKVPSLSEINSEVPQQVEEILQRALRRSPAERPAHCGVLARELERALYAVAPHVNQDDIAALVETAVPSSHTPPPEQRSPSPASASGRASATSPPLMSKDLSPASAARIAALPTERVQSGAKAAPTTDPDETQQPSESNGVHHLATHQLARPSGSPPTATAEAAPPSTAAATLPNQSLESAGGNLGESLHRSMGRTPGITTKWFVLAMLCGVLAGGLVALVGQRVQPEPPRSGKTIRRGPWLLELVGTQWDAAPDKATPSGRWVARVRVSRDGQPVSQAGRFFRLGQGAKLTPPCFWRPLTQGQWLLCFIAPKGAHPLRLRFHWPGIRPLELTDLSAG